jgi:hypothetical protein
MESLLVLLRARLRRSKNVAKSLHAARQLLRRGVQKIILKAIQLSVWAALPKNVEKRCGGAKKLPIAQLCLALRERNLQTRHGGERCDWSIIKDFCVLFVRFYGRASTARHGQAGSGAPDCLPGSTSSCNFALSSMQCCACSHLINNESRARLFPQHFFAVLARTACQRNRALSQPRAELPNASP